MISQSSSKVPDPLIHVKAPRAFASTLADMNAGDICNRSPVLVTARTTLAEAAALMREHQVGSLVVVDDAGSALPQGVVSDRHLALALADGGDPRYTAVERVMARDLRTVPEDESVSAILKLMRARGMRAVPVVDRTGRLAGVVTADGFLDLLSGQLADMMFALEKGLTGPE